MKYSLVESKDKKNRFNPNYDLEKSGKYFEVNYCLGDIVETYIRKVFC